MQGVPSELLYVLLFGAFLLFNFVMQKAARRRQAEVAQNQPEPEEIPEEEWRGSAADLQPPATAVAAQRRGAPSAAAPMQARRRFSRHALLGTRRQVQDAYVVATILGPCRGDQPDQIG